MQIEMALDPDLQRNPFTLLKYPSDTFAKVNTSGVRALPTRFGESLDGKKC